MPEDTLNSIFSDTQETSWQSNYEYTLHTNAVPFDGFPKGDYIVCTAYKGSEVDVIVPSFKTKPYNTIQKNEIQ